FLFLFVIFVFVIFLFMFSGYTGLGKGIIYLSNANLSLAVLLFFATLLLGPTLYILNSFTETLGSYVQRLPTESLRIAPNDADEQAWIMDWTIFFWAWWIAWAPFVGLFISRISKGRTIREFVLGVLLVPSIVSFLWMTTFGMSGIDAQQSGLDIASFPDEQALFAMFDSFPLSTVLSILGIL